MIAPLGRIISSHRGLVEACQQRAIDLEISRAELDRLAGWTDGYSAKLLGNGNSVRPKRLWPTGLELMLGVLGLKILLIEDETATAKTLSKRVPVVSSHQRFGNRSNLQITDLRQHETRRSDLCRARCITGATGCLPRAFASDPDQTRRPFRLALGTTRRCS
jgi:hypothetical protein